MFANLQIQTPISPCTTFIGFIVNLLRNGSEKEIMNIHFVQSDLTAMLRPSVCFVFSSILILAGSRSRLDKIIDYSNR